MEGLQELSLHMGDGVLSRDVVAALRRATGLTQLHLFYREAGACVHMWGLKR
jgi:hypothetical protein